MWHRDAVGSKVALPGSAPSKLILIDNHCTNQIRTWQVRPSMPNPKLASISATSTANPKSTLANLHIIAHLDEKGHPFTPDSTK